MVAEPHQNRMSQHVQEREGRAPSMIGRCCQVTEDSIRENPTLATLTAFGLGIGLGAVVGSLLVEPSGRSRRNTAERLGHRMLDSLTDVLPASLRQHIT